MLTGDTSGFHPVTQALIAADEADGLTTEQIIERRAGIMTVEFLGFVPNQVFLVLPDLAIADEIEIDGEIVVVPKFNPGNWYLEDNHEFL